MTNKWSQKDIENFAKYIQCFQVSTDLFSAIDYCKNVLKLEVSNNVYSDIEFLAQSLYNFGFEHIDFSKHYYEVHKGLK